MYDMIQKIFGEDRVKYFHSSDAHKMETGETWITYQYFQGDPKRVMLIFGSTEYDEVPLRVCSTPEELEDLVKALIY